jgi:hypothetical protein
LLEKCPGTEFALYAAVRTRWFGRTILIFIPLVICGARLHAGAVGTPAGITQEVARCLNLVRVAATRRSGRTNGGSADTCQPAGKSRTVGSKG